MRRKSTIDFVAVDAVFEEPDGLPTLSAKNAERMGHGASVFR